MKRFSFFIALLTALAAAQALRAAIVYGGDAASTIVSAPGTTPYTWSFTSGTSAGYVFLVINYETSATGWSATYDGNTMSVAATYATSSNVSVEVLYYSGSVKSPENIVITPPSNGYYTGAVSFEAFTYTGVTGIGVTSDGTAGGYSSSPSLTPSSSSSSILEIGNVVGGGCSGDFTLSTNEGTERYVYSAAETNEHGIGFADWAPGNTSSDTFTLTFAGCSNGATTLGVGIELKGAASGTNTDTPTITHTGTAGPTSTFSLTPTRTLTFTVGSSPTYSPTPVPGTSTYTLTSTPTPNATPAVSPTPSPTSSSASGYPTLGDWGDIENDNGNGTEVPQVVSYSSPSALNLTYYGANSLLLVFFNMQQSPPDCVGETYGSTPMALLAGPISEPNPGGSGTAYFWVYYLENPSQGQILTMNYGNPNNATVNSWWIDFGNVATGCNQSTLPMSSIGNINISSSTYQVVSGASQMTTTAQITTSQADSLILEYTPIFGTGFGWNYSTSTSTYGLSPGTIVAEPNPADIIYSSGIYLNDDAGTNGQFSEGEAWGTDVPGGAGTVVTVSQSLNAENEEIGMFNWLIEILPAGGGISCSSATPVPTTTYNCQAAPAGTTTPSPTPTLDPTNTPVIVDQGLPADMRPYGLEYVPFPTAVATAGTGVDQFYPLYETFSATATLCSQPPCSSGSGADLVNAYGGPVNTARWHLVLTGLTGTVKIETRIGPDGVTCESGVYDSGLYETATSLTLPGDPQDDSDSFFYVGTTLTGTSAVSTVADGGVPYTERFDAMGDPRFVPYGDELDFTDNPDDDGLGGGYNWFWRDFGDTGTYADEAQMAFYENFLPSAVHDEYVPSGESGVYGPNYDVPKLYGLIRDGIMASNAVYTTLAGWSAYFAGVGGEIGGDGNNGFEEGVPSYGGPWGSSSTGYHVDEVVGDYYAATQGSPGNDSYSGTDPNVNGACLVVTGTSASEISWASMPFLGELWPDGLYESQWEASGKTGSEVWGNLENDQEGGTAFRVPLANADGLPFGVSGAAGTYFLPVLHQAGEIGSASFFDGNNSNASSGAYFEHSIAASYEATALNDATQAASDYNTAIPPGYYDITAPWNEDLEASAAPPEWAPAEDTNPYYAERAHLDVYAAATYTAGGVSQADDWGYYTAPSSDNDTVTDKGAAAVRAVDMNLTLTTATGNPAGGWFIVNGIAPEENSQGGFLSQFALAEVVRTVADAGVPTAAACTVCDGFSNPNNTAGNAGAAGDADGKVYRIPPVPLVTILTPTASTLTQGLTTIPISWDIRYARWDGQQYDENYPCLDADVGPCSSGDLIPNPADEWQDPQAVAFNIIYSVPSGVSPTAWYSAVTGELCPADLGNDYVAGEAGGYMSDAADAILPDGTYQTSPYQYTYSWTNVAPASYLLRVECFRLPNETSSTPYPHYGYQQISVNTTP